MTGGERALTPPARAQKSPAAEPVRIRPAQEADLGALAALCRACFTEPWSEASLASALRGGEVLLVAASGGEIAGLIGMQAVCGEGYIHNVAVHPDFRRRGIGRALVEALLTHARAAGIRRIALDVRASNAAARALYEGCGFTLAARRPGVYVKPREDGCTMLWHALPGPSDGER